MPFPLLGLLLGAGLGGAKHFASDLPGRDRDRKLNATITRWSPWTNMAQKPEREANLFGSLLQGAAMGGLTQAGIGAMGGAAGGQSSGWDALMNGSKGATIDSLAAPALEEGAGEAAGAAAGGVPGAISPSAFPDTAMGYGAGGRNIGMWNSMLNANPYYG